MSVIDSTAASVQGFHTVIPRDHPVLEPAVDLAMSPPDPTLPVVGVLLAPGQSEYADRRRHDDVHRHLGTWIAGCAVAPLVLDTRLDTRTPFHCATPSQFDAVLRRVDAVLTTRLHGLVRGLSVGVPVLAVDPIDGGGKMTAQAHALRWPGIVGASAVQDDGRLHRLLRRCQSPDARSAVADTIATSEAGRRGMVRPTVSAITADREASGVSPWAGST